MPQRFSSSVRACLSKSRSPARLAATRIATSVAGLSVRVSIFDLLYPFPRSFGFLAEQTAREGKSARKKGGISRRKTRFSKKVEIGRFVRHVRVLFGSNC
jgi:hypothetical protein